MTDREAQIAEGRQRLVRRNWRFSLLPMMILGVLLVVLGWEVLRQNMGPGEWPWSITLLGVGPAATLCGVFASLLLAREQFARSMRPNLLWSARLQKSESLEGTAWSVRLLNVGPALAHVDAIDYSLVVMGPPLVRRKSVSQTEAVRALSECGLKPGRDFHLELVTPGAPLPVVKQRSEGIEFAAFTEEAVARLRQMDFSITVVDTMGDKHRKSLPFLATLPEGARPRAVAGAQPAEGGLLSPAPIHFSPETAMDLITEPVTAPETTQTEAPIVNAHVRALVNAGELGEDGPGSADPFEAHGRG